MLGNAKVLVCRMLFESAFETVSATCAVPGCREVTMWGVMEVARDIAEERTEDFEEQKDREEREEEERQYQQIDQTAKC